MRVEITRVYKELEYTFYLSETQLRPHPHLPGEQYLPEDLYVRFERRPGEGWKAHAITLGGRKKSNQFLASESFHTVDDLPAEYRAIVLDHMPEED